MAVRVLSVTMPDTQNGQAVAIVETLGELTATTVINGSTKRMLYALLRRRRVAHGCHP
jgi:hypothetical protein